MEIIILVDLEIFMGLDFDLLLYCWKEKRWWEEVLFNDMIIWVVVINIYVGDEIDNEKIVVKSGNIKGNVLNVFFISVY